MKAINFLLFLLCTLGIKSNPKEHYFYRCGIDDIKIKPISVRQVIPKDEDKRRLNNEEFKDFHIYLDIINIKNDLIKYNLTQYEKLFIDSMNKAVKTLETLLKVRDIKGGYRLNDETIRKMEIEDWNKTIIGTNATGDVYSLGIDLIIFARIDNTIEDSALANALATVHLYPTHQPLIGLVNINPKYDYSKKKSQEFFQSIIIHEFTHN